MFCREQVAQLRDAHKDIRKRGASLVVIGNGGVEQAAQFREERDLPFPLFVDPKLEAYRAAGLRRSVASSLSPKTMLHGIRALRKGERQGLVQGDPWQQGGVFVIGPNGKVIFSQVSREAGDHASPGDILAALDGRKGGGRK